MTRTLAPTRIRLQLAIYFSLHTGQFAGKHCKLASSVVLTLPSLVYSRTNPEDIDECCEQHAVDALRYGLTRRKIEFRLLPVYGI